jgi:hypothetical protein
MAISVSEFGEIAMAVQTHELGKNAVWQRKYPSMEKSTAVQGCECGRSFGITVQLSE